jgi:uncharacterized protein (TIGR03000 family)
MVRHTYTFAGLVTLTVAVVLLTGSPGTAQQQGWPLNPTGYNGFREQGSRRTPTYYPAATYLAPASPNPTPAAPAAGTAQSTVRSFYPSERAEDYGGLGADSTGNRAIRINVSVPAEAQIWFNGARTVQGGSVRSFVSPPVTPGQDYYYDVTATWQQGGREVTRSQRITVHAGDAINLNF